MKLTPLAPVARPGDTSPRWGVAASTVLHLVAIALVIGIAARQSPPPGEGAPAFDLVFESPSAQPDQSKPPGLPPIQPADVPVPDDAPVGAPAPVASSPPKPEGLATPLPEAPSTPATPASAPTPEPAETSPPMPTPADTPVPTASAPAPAESPLPQLAFAPPAEPAITTEPAPPESRPETAPPTVNLQLPSEADQQPSAPLDLTPIMPQPPKPLPPLPPRPRPPAPPRQALGTLSNPMDLSFAPSAPRPAARGLVASRAFDLSPPPERQGASRSDPYARIRAANASEDWNRGLLQYWLRHRFYPPQAAQNGDQGTVTIQLTVDRSGHVDDVEILSRSGSQWLDMAAVAVFRGATLPPLPSDVTEASIPLHFTIHYIIIN